MFYIGCCENRMDPLKLGRCKVRVVGLHTEDKTVLPTDELPWAYPMMPINSASISGIGWSPTGIVPGSWVIVIFLDDMQQQPIMLGTIGGIPNTKTAAMINDASNSILTVDDTGELVNSMGDVLTDLINSTISLENPAPTTVQVTGQKYQVTSVASNTSTGNTILYNVVSIIDLSIVATATYSDTTKLYSVMLLNGYNYTQEQYTPFMGGGAPVTFKTTQEITDYFDKNF